MEADLSQAIVARRTRKALALKSATIFFGILAMALSLAALKKATYYESVCTKQGQRTVDLNPGWASAVGYKCEDLTSYTYEQCQFIEKRIRDGAAGERRSTRDYPKCLLKWLVQPQVYMLAITWAFGSIVLIVISVASQQQPANPKFSNIDCLTLWVTGGISLLCGLCMMAFIIGLVTSEFWCVDKPCSQTYVWGGCHPLVNRIYRYYPVVIKSASQSNARGFDENRKYTFKTCSDYNNNIYQPWLLLCGTLFALVAGLIGVVSGFMLRNARVRQGFQRMPYQTQQIVVGIGSQYQQPQLMNQQQYGYQNPSQSQMMNQQQYGYENSSQLQ